MQLTGKEIIDKGIIKGHGEKSVQQYSIDVCVDEIKMVCNNGVIHNDENNKEAQFPKYVSLSTTDNYYILNPGYYEVILKESCDIPQNCTLQLKTCASLIRCGMVVYSEQFEAGFKTDQMTCFLQIIRPGAIEKNAKIAQAIVFENIKEKENNTN